MNPDQYCTVLNVLNIINTNILGLTFWGASVEFIASDSSISAGVVYFLYKDEALGLEIGNRFLR
ncbi:MAG: hypothetical protein ACRYFB_07405 [Janthinobacterium lividum]